MTPEQPLPAAIEPDRHGRLQWYPWHRHAIRTEVERELRSHLLLHVDDLRAQGMSAEDAEAHARQQFEQYAATLTHCQEIRMSAAGKARRGTLWHEFRQDVRFALRTLARRPGHAALLIGTLAIGVGSSAVVLQTLDTAVLSVFPFRRPAELVVVEPMGPVSQSKQMLELLRRRSTDFTAIAGYSQWGFTLTGDGHPEEVDGGRATANLFELLGLEAQLGRTFAEGEDQPGNDAVAVISHGLWLRRFGADSSVVSRTMEIDGRPHQVIGVLPAATTFPTQKTEVWIPATIEPADADDYSTNYLTLVGRLGPDATIASAEAGVNRALEGMVVDGIIPSLNPADPPPSLTPLRTWLLGRIRPTLLLLFGAACAILGLACANVANLLHVQTRSRAQELAIRAALGAGRGRLVRQLVTESLVLAAAAAVVSVGLAAALSGALVLALAEAVVPSNAAVLGSITIGWIIAVSLLIGLGLGLYRSRWVESELSILHLRSGSSGQVVGWRRALSIIAITQVTVAVVLMIGAALMVQSHRRLVGEDPGFRAEGVLSFSVAPPSARYSTDEQQAAYHKAVLEQLLAIPGVTVAGAVHLMPLSGNNWNPTLHIEGAPLPEGASREVDWRSASPGYFETMGVGLIRGRMFDESDHASGMPVAVVTEALARRDFPGSDPIGKRVRTGFEPEGQYVTIVGVVADMKEFTLAGPGRPAIYRPLGQMPISTMAMMVRTSQSPDALSDAVREAVWRVDPEVPISNPRPFESVVRHAAAPQRRFGTLLGVAGALALVIALVGVYGMVSYVADQRSREYALRKAFGATGRDISLAIMQWAVTLAAAGVLAGLVAAALATRMLGTYLYGIAPLDLATFAGVGAVMVLAASLASVRPAWRVARADPAHLLRA